jgi:uncharacterized protein (DUF1330 family)
VYPDDFSNNKNQKEAIMSAYVVANYRITNPDAIAPYAAAATETLVAAGAEVMAVDLESEVIEGEPQPVTVILKFASKEAMKAWYNSPEYQAVKGLRTDNSEGTIVLINGMD